MYESAAGASGLAILWAMGHGKKETVTVVITVTVFGGDSRARTYDLHDVNVTL